MKLGSTVMTFVLTSCGVLANPTPATEVARAASAPISNLCPQVQDLYFKGASGTYYNIQCGVDIKNAWAVAVYENIPNVTACAAECDLWNQELGSGCSFSTWYTVPLDGVNNCVSWNDGNGWTEVSNSNATAVFPQS